MRSALVIALVACLGLAASGSPEDVDSVVPEMIKIESEAAATKPKGKPPAKAAAKHPPHGAKHAAAEAPAHQPPTREEMEHDPYLKQPVNPAEHAPAKVAAKAAAKPAGKGKPAKAAAKAAAKPKGKPAKAAAKAAAKKLKRHEHIALLRKKHRELVAKLNKKMHMHALRAAVAVEHKVGKGVRAFEKRAEAYETRKAETAIKRAVHKLMNKEVEKEVAALVKKELKEEAPKAVKDAKHAADVKAKCGKAADNKSKARMCRTLHYMCDLKSANALQKKKAKDLFEELSHRFNERQPNKKEQMTPGKKEAQFVKYVQKNCKLSCCKVEHDLWK